MHVVRWGVYDTGKPRTRILHSALRAAGKEFIEIHREVWRGGDDKSQVTGAFSRLRLLFAWLAAYPLLIRADDAFRNRRSVAKGNMSADR